MFYTWNNLQNINLVSLSLGNKKKKTHLFSYLILRCLVVCILKLMNSQTKYMKTSSLTNSKQNCTWGFIPPHLFTNPLDLPVCFTCLISLKTHGSVSKGHNFLSNNDSHPWFEAFWSQWIYLSKTHRGRIFFKLVVYIYIYIIPLNHINRK